jgi:nitrite reductase/ring-hydroxylating ferredoxin subunit
MSTPEPAAPARLPLCASADLAERGRAVRFAVSQYGREVPAFALRIDGRVVAYLNRCAHVPVEMDWQPGDFLDAERRYIVCSIHGAMYEPAHGGCVAGPCAGARLIPVDVREEGQQVYWYPSRHLQPLAEPPAAPPTASPA